MATKIPDVREQAILSLSKISKKLEKMEKGDIAVDVILLINQLRTIEYAQDRKLINTIAKRYGLDTV